MRAVAGNKRKPLYIAIVRAAGTSLQDLQETEAEALRLCDCHTIWHVVAGLGAEPDLQM
jgi:hypothetical protein